MLLREIPNSEVGTLSCADYAIGVEVGVERKKINNLLGSMTKRLVSGKTELWDQLDRCQLLYKHTYLLIEGDLDPGTEPSWCYADGRRRQIGYLAVIATIEQVQEHGIHVIWTRDSAATAKVLRWLHQRYGHD